MKWQKLFNATILGGFLLGGALVLQASAQTTGVLQDQIPGSFLVFPIFDISSGSTTQIRICDKSNGPIQTGNNATTWVRLNFICPGSLEVGDENPFCDEYDTDFKLTSHQCAVIDVRDKLPPCELGFIVAFAENSAFQPWSYDNLIGSYNITRGTGASAVVEGANAIAIQSSQPKGTLLGHPGSLGSDELLFQEVAANAAGFAACGLPSATCPDYVGTPAQLHSDFRAVAPGLDTNLILLTLNINSGVDNNTTSVKVYWWDLFENPNSASHKFVCWDRVALADIDSHFTAAGLTTKYGSLRVNPIPSNCPFPDGQCVFGGQYKPTVLGAIEEIGSVGPPVGSGATIRNLFHTGSGTPQNYGPE